MKPSNTDQGSVEPIPVMGAPGLRMFTVGGVTIAADKDAQALHIVDADGQIVQLPKGAHFNAQKGTVDLPGGDHLTFSNGRPVRNTPQRKTNKLAPTRYDQNPYTGPGQKIVAGVDMTPTPKPVANGAAGPVLPGHAPGSVRPTPQAAPSAPPIDQTHSPAPMPTGGKTAVPAVGGPPVAGGTSQQIAGGGNTHDFAVDLLKGLNLPVTASNVQAIMAWSQAESLPGKGASFNPMNTTQPAAGATNFNSVGVKNFTSYEQGLQATIQTLKNGHYGPILQALQQGNDAFAVGKAVAASPWGTGEGVLRVLNGGNVQNQPIASGGGSAGYGPPTGTTGSAATAGTGTATGTGANSTVPDFDPKKFAAALAAAGFSAHLINSDEGLKAAFQNAVATQQSVADFQNAIVNTHWYQSRSASMRQYDLDNQADHTTLSARVAASTASIQAQAAKMGVTISPLRAHDIAVTAMRSGLAPEEVQKSIAAEAHYDPHASYGGTFGTSIDQLKKLAADYHVQLDDNTIGQFAQQITAGTSDIEKFQQFVQQQAASKYPWMKAQLDQGFTVSQLASPYKTSIAQNLELDPNTISDNDPLLQRGLQASDGKGGFSTMPLYQFDQAVKSDPRWLATHNARNSLMDVGVGVLQDMGLSS